MTVTPANATRRQGVAVDWVYIRYRTVAWMVAIAVVGTVAIVGWWWWNGRTAPDETTATSAIQSAEQLLGEAEAKSPDARELALSRAHIERARDELSAARYGSAIDEARTAESLARDALGGPFADGGPSVRVARIEGDVRVKRAGQFLWERASEQMVLEASDQIRTGGDGLVQLVYFDGSVMTLNPGTLLELRDLLHDPKGRTQRVSERLAWGSVEGTTESRDGSKSVHELATDSASVRATTGSQFRVRHDREKGESEVVSLGGNVFVRTQRGEIPLETNTRIALLGGEIVDRGRLLDGPRPIAPPDQKTFLGPSDSRVSLTWGPVKGAHHYHLQLSDRSVFARTMLDMDHVANTAIDLPPLVPGNYHWRVAALDEKGRSGQWSESRRFRLTGAEFNDPDDRDPPRLEVSEILVIGTNAIMSGCSEAGVLVWIEGERVDIADDGCFRWVVKLRHDGQNKIHLLAQDAAGNETRRFGYAYVDVF